MLWLPMHPKTIETVKMALKVTIYLYEITTQVINKPKKK